MKKIFVYLLGIITGVVLTIAVSAVVANSSSVEQDNGLSMFEERGDMMPERSYQIFRVLDDTHALAKAVSIEEFGWYIWV